MCAGGEAIANEGFALNYSDVRGLHEARGTLQSMPQMRLEHTWLRRAALLLIVAAHWIVVGRSLDHELVWDDRLNIEQNEYLGRSFWEGIAATQHDHMSTEFTEHTGRRLVHDSYRPLLFISYSLDVALFGKDATALRAHNLVLGTLMILAVYAVVLRLGHGSALALPITAVFALHPLQVEPVVYVSARSDLLGGLLAMGAAHAVLSSADRRYGTAGRLGFAVAAFGSSFLGLWAKEAYAALPLALLCLAVAADRVRAMRLGLLATLFATLLYVPLRLGTMHGQALPSAEYTAKAWYRLGAIGMDYVRVFFLPFSLSTERLYRSGLEWLGWLVWVALGLLAMMWLRRRDGRGRSDALWVLGGLGFMWVLLGPSAIVVAVQDVMADRYMYLPIVGTALSVAVAARWLVRKAPRARAALALAGSLWAVLLCFVSFQQVNVWRNNLSLYTHAMRTEPDSAMAFYRYGYQLASEQRWSEAEAALQRAAELNPSKPMILNNLGVAQMRLGRLDQAETAFRKAIGVSRGTHHRAYYNLGLALAQRRDLAEACSAWRAALELYPGYGKARAALNRHCSAAVVVPDGAK